MFFTIFDVRKSSTLNPAYKRLAGYSCPKAYPASVASMASAGAELLPPTDENAISCPSVCGEPARWSLGSFVPPPSALGAPKVATGARGAGWRGASDGFLRMKGSAPIVGKQRRHQHHDYVDFGAETVSWCNPLVSIVPFAHHKTSMQGREISKAGSKAGPAANGPTLGYSTEEVPISPHFRFQGDSIPEPAHPPARRPTKAVRTVLHSTQSFHNQRR